VIDSLASKLFVGFVDLDLSPIETGSPVGKLVLSFDFGVREAFGLLLCVFFGGAVEGPFFVVDTNAIVEVEFVLPRSEILNDVFEALQERQHFSYAKIAIHKNRCTVAGRASSRALEWSLRHEGREVRPTRLPTLLFTIPSYLFDELIKFLDHG